MHSEADLRRLLSEGAGAFGAVLDEGRLELFMKYMGLLKEWNQKFNLTAIEEDRDIIVKHFIDSLSLLPHIPKECTNFIDIGTGAGFPGIPVKIAWESLPVTLADSLEKRVGFLREAVSVLGLKDITAVHSRAEDLGRDGGHRERYGFAAARAVAGLPVLLEYCLPFVKMGGLFAAMKGSDTKETESAGKALNILGGEIVSIREFLLPFSDIKRSIIIVRKFRQTPTHYPRKAGKPSKNPLV